MAVVFVNEVGRNREADFQIANKSLKRTFQVKLSSPSDGPAIAVTAAGIPGFGDAHPDVLQATVDQIRTIETNSRQHFDVEVNYTSDTEVELEDNPLDDIATFSFGFEKITEVIANDRNGVAILNSAGDIFDPPLTEERSLLNFTFTRNEAAFDPVFADDMVDSVNDGAITIADFPVLVPARVKLVEFSATSGLRNNIEFFVVTYKLLFRNLPPGFNRELLDRGFNFIDAAGKKRVIILEGDATPAQTEQLLDGQGGVLPQGGQPVFLPPFETLQQRDFALLELPQTVN